MGAETKTFYEILGKEKIAELVFHFYALVYEDPILSDLFQNDIAEVRDKQFRFLCQFLGGPPLYIETYGPPKMRMRHLPFVITHEKKDAWLACMNKAITQLNLDERLSQELYSCFVPLAKN